MPKPRGPAVGNNNQTETGKAFRQKCSILLKTSHLKTFREAKVKESQEA